MKIPTPRELAAKLAGYFNITPYLIPQAEAEESIGEGVSFRGINIIILIVAIFIASLGLNTNSTAVIIGAMLISPLMGPIIGIGLAVGVHDFELMKRSFRNLMMATAFSVLTSCIYFMISPVNEAHSELLARTSPTIYDVFIGFFGGMAGILAVGSRLKGNVIPGVAIATALMPPLCTVGYGLATLQLNYFLGALYLFFINSVFIATATTLGVRFMKYQVREFSNPVRARRVRNTVYSIAVATILPSIYLTYTMYVTNTYNNNCARFVNTEFHFPATQVVSYNNDNIDGQRTLTVTLMGQALPADSLMQAMDSKLQQYHLDNTRLRIIQGNGSQVDVRQASQALLSEMYASTQATISRQQSTIDSLRGVIADNAALDTVSATLAPELHVIFPHISSIAVARTCMADIATGTSDTTCMALVNATTPMSQGDIDKLRSYLEVRLHQPRVQIIQQK